MPGKGSIAELRKDYRSKRRAIEQRLREFREVPNRGDEAVFEELCFCILTAGSSARMGMRTVEALRDILMTGTREELQRRAEQHRVRFWRLRPAYIHGTRQYLQDTFGMRLRDLLESFDEPLARREFLAANRAIKGLGFKEASHFLRNVGYRGYAILDKHIVSSLRELGVIDKRLKPTSRAGYLAIEKRLQRFSREIGIDMDHLDLLLWSRKTGEILK